jgi:putative Mg2+ transporter-C (MgtC) family protein
MEHFVVLSPFFNDYLIKLFLAMFFGLIIGTERIIAHKTAGMRTYALVSMGAALFVLVAHITVGLYAGMPGYNPSAITAAVVSGIGFLGTGLMIWRDKEHLSGLTSATSLWVSAGIGMAVGYGAFDLALLATILTIFVFVVLWFIEQKIRKLPITWENAQPTLPVDDSNAKN